MSAPAAPAKQSPLIDDMLMLWYVVAIQAQATLILAAVALWQLEHGLDN